MPDTWSITPKTKFYEALGAVYDVRLFDITNISAKVYSSDRAKFYSVKYDPTIKAITCNDNSSYWVGYVGYPAIAFLLKIGVLNYDPNLAKNLSGIPWKKINQQFKNDFEAALDSILKDFDAGIVARLDSYVDMLHQDFQKLELKKLGITEFPPKAKIKSN